MLKQSSVDMNNGLDIVQFQKSLEEINREKECWKYRETCILVMFFF